MPATTAKLALPYPLGSDPVSDGDDAIKALADRLELIFGSTPWTAATLINGYTNHASGPAAAYRLVGDRVEVRGLVVGPLANAAFLLPVGMRPPQSRFFAQNSNQLFGAVSVDPDGSVKPVAGASTTWMSLVIAFSV